MMARLAQHFQTMRYSISALPLAAPSQLLTQNLTPDRLTPTVSAFRSSNQKSLSRRARLLAPESHFSYVIPLPTSFPYDIEPPSPDGSDNDDASGSYIENWLAAREASVAQPPIVPNAPLTKHVPQVQAAGPARLLGISETALRDCVPHLEVGDAFAHLGAPGLAGTEPAEEPEDGLPEAVAAREDLVDVCSGRAVLMSDTFAPWSMRYSGHQFGSWAGQLGDGRATSILVTPHPSDPVLTYELQLKGSGRTPFSRSADGLAVTRSSIREYLGSEAMQALGIPTTRALSLVSLPDVSVAREKLEKACVLTRLAPSFVRIGCFEAFSPPQNTFLFGGGQQVAHWDGLRILGEWVAKNVLGLDVGKPWGQALVLEAARRNALMVAGWQAYGFMHGVINTDNVSIMGLTIDYGPFAFMDVFDPYHICNHTDEEGRYAYRSQPTNILFALRALHTALAPLIGAELSLGHAVEAGWAEGGDIAAWKTSGLDALKDEIERVTQSEMAASYAELMRKRLALRTAESTDEAKIVRPLLDLMADQKLDFHGTFRTLCGFSPGMSSDEKDRLVERLQAQAPDMQLVDQAAGSKALRDWLDVYSERVEREADAWGAGDRQAAARNANPRFVLRQWVLEEVIAVVEKDPVRGKQMLAKVMHMASNPFQTWGAEDSVEELSAEETEERRFCGFGEKKMLGFQCSCSS
ncbi:unnamed protein product [Mycena citricolor]|uniref:Selenoprotein O n=2 Tax=Mycena citricolor TaxID=2018698 RepID=A0AAD2H512_9AGAR|nr:unnamed protein product [Mycena citricolor]